MLGGRVIEEGAKISLFARFGSKCAGMLLSVAILAALGGCKSGFLSQADKSAKAACAEFQKLYDGTLVGEINNKAEILAGAKLVDASAKSSRTQNIAKRGNELLQAATKGDNKKIRESAFEFTAACSNAGAPIRTGLEPTPTPTSTSTLEPALSTPPAS